MGGLLIGFAHPTYDFSAFMAAKAPQQPFVHLKSPSELLARIGDVEILAQSSVLWNNELIPQARKLRFIQALSVGTEHFGLPALRAHGIRLANAAGCNDIAVAEHAMGLILTLTRRLHLARDDQTARLFRRHGRSPVPRQCELHGQTLLIIGLGGIGGRLAGMAKAFGMRVLALRRDAAAGAGAADAVFSQADLLDVLPQADIIALTCPLTPQTRGIINSEAFARMKPGALLINVARGAVVAEAAMIAALAAGQIGGAGLDCFETEPLPATSALWDFANVMITPHSAGETAKFEERFLDLLLQNGEKLTSGAERLRNEFSTL